MDEPAKVLPIGEPRMSVRYPRGRLAIAVQTEIERPRWGSPDEDRSATSESVPVAP